MQAVKGQDERRPSAAPLTAPQVTIGRLWLTPGHTLPEQPMVVISFDEIICTNLHSGDAGTKLSGSGKSIRLARVRRVWAQVDTGDRGSLELSLQEVSFNPVE